MRSSALAEARKERFRRLIDDHFDGVWRFLRRIGVPAHLAEDVSQDVFLIAARRLDDIKPGHSPERSFLIGTAYRVARDIQRKAQREAPQEDVDVEIDTAPTPEEQLDEKQERELLYRLLGELEDDVRPLFMMHQMNEMTMYEIARLMGLPVGTVRSRLHRARAEFSARLERHRKRLGGW